MPRRVGFKLADCTKSSPVPGADHARSRGSAGIDFINVADAAVVCRVVSFAGGGTVAIAVTAVIAVADGGLRPEIPVSMG